MSRSDRPAQMSVEWATNEQFKNACVIDGPPAPENSRFTARIDLADLPPEADIHYRVRFRNAPTSIRSAR